MLMAVAKKQSRGRQRIEIKRIANQEVRHVCFSKRRAGLFKKACELSILSGSEVSVVVFSPAGRAFSFGHPSVDSVANRLLAGSNSSGGRINGQSRDVSIPEGCNNVEALNRTCTELQALAEAAKDQNKNLKKELTAKQEMEPFWWTYASIWDMGFTELTEFERLLKGLKCKVAAQRRIEQLLVESYIQKPFSDDSFGNVDGGGGGVAFAANAPFAVKNDDAVQLAPLPPSLVGLDYDYSAIYDNLD